MEFHALLAGASTEKWCSDQFSGVQFRPVKWCFFFRPVHGKKKSFFSFFLSTQVVSWCRLNYFCQLGISFQSVSTVENKLRLCSPPLTYPSSTTPVFLSSCSSTVSLSRLVVGDLLQQLQAAGTADPIIDLTSKLISANIYPPKSQVPDSLHWPARDVFVYDGGEREKEGRKK